MKTCYLSTVVGVAKTAFHWGFMPTVLYLGFQKGAEPGITGVSKKTLIEDNELFLFDDEVEPILSVLCGKTLEIARMEVLQEEELAEM